MDEFPKEREHKERSIYQRCWCDQWGRCLTDCPSADVPRPDNTAFYDKVTGEVIRHYG